MANYVNGPKLTKILNDYHKKKEEIQKYNEENPENPKQLPVMDNYIAESIMAIAKNFVWFGTFRFIPLKDKDDMMSNGILYALDSIENRYDPSKIKSGNAFAFVTQQVRYGFLEAINISMKNFNVRNAYMHAIANGQSPTTEQSAHTSSILHDIRATVDQFEIDKIQDNDLDYLGKKKRQEQQFSKDVRKQDMLERKKQWKQHNKEMDM